MYSLLLRTMVRILMPLILLFSLFVFARGHQDPGGGFVGGLVAAAAIVLWVVAEGASDARRRFPIRPSTLSALGLSCAAAAALIPLGFGRPFLTSLWYHLPLPGGGHFDLGTTTLFDLGVYLVVVGTVLLFVFTLELRPNSPEER
jgi:multicomponent Na+:H+ antiporter subunit B